MVEFGLAIFSKSGVAAHDEAGRLVIELHDMIVVLVPEHIGDLHFRPDRAAPLRAYRVDLH